MPSGSWTQLSIEAAVVVATEVEAKVLKSVTVVLVSEEFFFAHDVLIRVVEFSKQPPILQSVNTSLSSYKIKYLVK